MLLELQTRETLKREPKVHFHHFGFQNNTVFKNHSNSLNEKKIQIGFFSEPFLIIFQQRELLQSFNSECFSFVKSSFFLFIVVRFGYVCFSWRLIAHRYDKCLVQKRVLFWLSSSIWSWYLVSSFYVLSQLFGPILFIDIPCIQIVSDRIFQGENNPWID